MEACRKFGFVSKQLRDVKKKVIQVQNDAIKVNTSHAPYMLALSSSRWCAGLRCSPSYQLCLPSQCSIYICIRKNVLRIMNEHNADHAWFDREMPEIWHIMSLVSQTDWQTSSNISTKTPPRGSG